jgi:glutaminyl-tRNA synthetase
VTENASGPRAGSDFIRTMIADDVATARHNGRVVTRFPPEPNGFLHIGHVKSICLNFGIAEENAQGECHLRFDDTNPETEDIRYVDSIQNDVRWLGFDWGPHLYFASDYFEAMYAYAEELIRTGNAYVDSSTEEEIREARGTVTQAGRPTAFRNRTVEENLDLFRRMRAGEFPNGAHVLRGKIDLSSNNMLMRDPVLYRIRHASHYRTGDAWCIYPLYDYAHPIEDAIEGVTHSLCTLEFDNNRELYDWVVSHLPRDPAHPFAIDPSSQPRQTEFARLALDYTVMSKRKLLQLVNEQLVSGWDDPRMPTVAGMRRRGMTPESLRAFAELVGVAKANSRVDIAKLEFAIREDLNLRVPRVLCVLRPLRVVITNYPEGDVEQFDAPYYPHDVPLEGSRKLPFSREILIDQDDFREDPPKNYNRLAPGREVRLRYAYIIRCDDVIKDERGNVVELRCSYDPDTRGGNATRSVKGTIHWVSAAHAVPCEVRLYDRLFSVADPDAVATERNVDWKSLLNPESLVVLETARVEPSVVNDPPGSRYQFERVGYFTSDSEDSSAERLVFNRTVSLRESFHENGTRASDGRPDRAAGNARKGTSKDTSKSHSLAGKRDASPAFQDTAVIPPRSADLERRMAKLIEELGISAAQADIITRDARTADLYDAAITAGTAEPAAVANWVVNELPRIVRDRSLTELALTGAHLATVIAMVARREISGVAAREVVAELAEHGGDPATIVQRRNLRQVDDTADIETLVRGLMTEFDDRVQQYRSGRTGLLGFFVGQVMTRTQGRANPQTVNEVVRTMLDG